jgi:hypothetical protein
MTADSTIDVAAGNQRRPRGTGGARADVEGAVTMTGATGSRLVLVVLLAILASGCGVIGGIFKAGVWFGALLVILLLVVVIFIARKARR